ncbi:hypothetical protein [Catenuloplanes atrovinosus]|uniref:Uncharacterized protein n=1 Tax=Catenuloplanes atrovinosus TaxID=137266 RepID=A0AAE3YKK6_9ACTN|nr:hypothetical protein [Catenuloplanes atrovinosus]MDR7274006.1 hypothetical protein [Catenuloplanes atrovinosus]
MTDLDGLWVADRARQNEAYERVMAATRDAAVPWADALWPVAVARLGDADNHSRAIAAQVLCNLAAHDRSGRIAGDLDALIEVTRDPRFVTARHCLRALWRIGLAGDVERALIVAALGRRYREAATEKNGTLIRSDIIESLRLLRDATADPAVEPLARELIALEDDPKYRKKYAGHWR